MTMMNEDPDKDRLKLKGGAMGHLSPKKNLGLGAKKTLDGAQDTALAAQLPLMVNIYDKSYQLETKNLSIDNLLNKGSKEVEN